MEVFFSGATSGNSGFELILQRRVDDLEVWSRHSNIIFQRTHDFIQDIYIAEVCQLVDQLAMVRIAKGLVLLPPF